MIRRTLLASILAVAAVNSARATILPFEMTPFPGIIFGGYQTTYASYGDNVTNTSMAGPGVTYSYGMGYGFTPDITVDYSFQDNGTINSQGHSLHVAQLGWSDPVDYLHAFNPDVFWYTFTPANGVGVRVNSFAIDMFGGGGVTLNWKLREDSTSGTIFASGQQTGLSSANPDTIVNTGAEEYFGTVVLEIDFSGGGNGNMGIDDLNFDQVAAPPIPEPGTWLLLTLSGLALARRIRSLRK